MYAFAAALPFTSRAGFDPRRVARFAREAGARRAAVLRDFRRRRGAAAAPAVPPLPITCPTSDCWPMADGFPAMNGFHSRIS
jgi:hypothetical protein